MPLSRSEIFPESSLPDMDSLVSDGRALASSVSVGPCAFLQHHGSACEADFKRRCISESRLTMHAQFGYRDLEKSKRAALEIFQRLGEEGCRVDRYGICLDWSMVYPRRHRAGMPRGTGLILDTAEAFAELTAVAPVESHFGDFVIGTPAALENTIAALGAGATVIGNRVDCRAAGESSRALESRRRLCIDYGGSFQRRRNGDGGKVHPRRSARGARCGA